MSSSAAAAAPASLLVLGDEILEEIFLRLDAAADLARASAACSAFLRVVRFLRRNRPLYRPPAVLFFEFKGLPPGQNHPLHHAEPPHRSASAARALAQAADFTLSFLPDPSSWVIRDASGGRLLLSSSPAYDSDDLYDLLTSDAVVFDDLLTSDAVVFDDLVVCDPLHCRHVRIPQVPIDLNVGMPEFESWTFPSLTPDGEEEERSSLLVIWLVVQESNPGKVTGFVFSSATGEWRGVTFNGWRHLTPMYTSCRYHPHRSLWRTSGLLSEVLMLNAREMKFSVVCVPRVHDHRQHAIVDAGEGRLGFLTLGGGVLDLYCKAWQGDGVDSEEWQHERTIPLPDGFRYSYAFIGVGGSYLLLRAVPLPRDSAELDSHLQQSPEIQYFTLNIKTLLLERLCALNEHISFAFVYENFPPPLSLSSV